MSLTDPVPRQLLSDEAYWRIREAIVTGELAPGARIKDTELAAGLGLSRTPVREALARLVDNGLIEATPGVSTRITLLDSGDIANVLSILRVLDQHAIITAVPRMTSADIHSLRLINDEFAAAVRSSDARAALAADERFHRVPLLIAGGSLLTRVTDQLHPQIDRVLYRKFSTLFGLENTVSHHAALIDLFEAGDAETAARRSSDHWTQLGEVIHELFATDQLSN